MITLAFANLVRTTITVGELLVWTFLAIFSSVAVYFLFSDGSIVELNRLKIYCAAISSFVIWFLFLVVVGSFGQSNDMKVEDEKDN
jgi:hypothetical protein